jgi:hypothetical protein
VCWARRLLRVERLLLRMMRLGRLGRLDGWVHVVEML